MPFRQVDVFTESPLLGNPVADLTRSSSGLPAAAVHNLIERPPVGVPDRREWPVGRVAQRYEEGPVTAIPAGYPRRIQYPLTDASTSFASCLSFARLCC